MSDDIVVPPSSAESETRSPSSLPGPSGAPWHFERLDSWKEIAAYLKRSVRTVQRWEKLEGLPAHRHVHDDLSSVYAHRSEIDAWSNARRKPAFPLASIVQSADDAIVCSTLAGTIATWNPAAERIYGYTAKAALGQPLRALLPPDHSADVLDVCRRVTRGEHVERYETLHVREDGRRIAVNVSVAALRDAKGRTVGVCSIIREIGAGTRGDGLPARGRDGHGRPTRARASEAPFQAVVESAFDAVVLADDHGRVLYFNRSAERMFGYAAADVVGQPVSLLLLRPPEERERSRLRALASAGATVEVRGRRKDGKELALEVSLASWDAGAGELTFSGIARRLRPRPSRKRQPRA